MRGAKDNIPRTRSDCGSDYYAAFFDSDGTNVEAVTHGR
jgi:hypothetical protein